MLKQFFVLLISLIFIPLSSTMHMSADSIAPEYVEPVVHESEPVDTESGVLAARIENLLNLNRVFDNGFENPREIIEEVEIQLLGLAVSDEFGQQYINQEYVLSFIKQLYGIDVEPKAGLYDFLPAPDGYFAIPAKGYSLISHRDIEYTILPNGDINVNSVMTIDAHDSEPVDVKVKTLLRPNSDSVFGYNIISSDIIE
ncbi:MAG TPA: hypothetical protein GXX17_07185 [Clostridiales bacterium]|nr:hypothetical protein [Clostridiales bacterium]